LNLAIFIDGLDEYEGDYSDVASSSTHLLHLVLKSSYAADPLMQLYILSTAVLACDYKSSPKTT